MYKSLNDICDLSESAAPTAVVSHEPREVSVSFYFSFLYVHPSTPHLYICPLITQGTCRGNTMSTSKAQEEDMMELMSGSIEGGKRGMKRGAHDVESNIEAGRKRAKGSGASLVTSTTGHFSLLPLELDALIASYCSMEDQMTFSHGNKNLRSIMRTANLIRYKLSEESCNRYVNDLVFRDVVDSRGHVWELKFEVLDNPADTSLVDVSFLSRVQILKLQNCSAIIDVSPLSNAHTLDLSNMSGVTDVSALSSVHTLTL